MKKYNINTDKIEELPSVVQTDSGSMYTNKMSNEALITEGYYPIAYGSIPNRRYYTYTESKSLMDNVYTITYTPVERNITEVQALMLSDLSTAYAGYTKRPRVDSGIGFFVDGGRDDLLNFQIGQKHSIMTVRDADNIDHVITAADYVTIITAMEAAGIAAMQLKWFKGVEIGSMLTVADCVLYEATPYQATVDILDPITFLPTGGTEVVTKYKNNVKEW